MKRFITAAVIAAFSSGLAFAQESGSEDTKSEEAQIADAEFPVAQAAGGEPELRATFGDWEQRCINPGENEKCVIVQFGRTESGEVLSRITIEALPADADAAAGVTIIGPLGVLLQAGLSYQVDDGRQNRYPFAVCEASGCLSRFGLTATEIEVMKAGDNVVLGVVPPGADQPLPITITLAEFTNAWESISEQ